MKKKKEVKKAPKLIIPKTFKDHDVYTVIRCLGACSRKARKYKGLTFRQAVKVLRSDYTSIRWVANEFGYDYGSPTERKLAKLNRCWSYSSRPAGEPAEDIKQFRQISINSIAKLLAGSFERHGPYCLKHFWPSWHCECGNE